MRVIQARVEGVCCERCGGEEEVQYVSHNIWGYKCDSFLCQLCQEIMRKYEEDER